MLAVIGVIYSLFAMFLEGGTQSDFIGIEDLLIIPVIPLLIILSSGIGSNICFTSGTYPGRDACNYLWGSASNSGDVFFIVFVLLIFWFVIGTIIGSIIGARRKKSQMVMENA